MIHKQPWRSLTMRVLLIACFALLSACQAAGTFRFERVLIDGEVPGGYGLTVADVDGDGRDDIIALATNPAQFVWYRNPTWEKYQITATSSGNIAVAAQDIDGDGDIDLVLASEFDLRASTEGGLVQWFENPGNPMENQQWQAYKIDSVPTSHRLRWADIRGSGKPALINLPIIGIGAVAPRYETGAQLKAYPLPANPRGPWTSVVLDDSLEMAHGLAVVDWNADGRDELLTASFTGIDLLRFASDGVFVKKTQLGEGERGERPHQGSSEVALGTLRRGKRFLASIEPWHGNEVVVYEAGEEASLPWVRRVIDDSLVGGHALLVADLNNDGRDEIIAGNRSIPYGLYYYRYQSETGVWERSSISEGRIAVSGLAIADFTGNGFLDIVAIGTATGNVVLFKNRGR